MTNFHAFRCLLSIILLTALGSAHADRAQTERLLELTGLDHSIEVMATQISQLVQAQVAQFPTDEKNSELVTRYLTEIHEMIMGELTWTNLKDDFVSAYDETFSEAEVADLVAFFTTPTGAKYVARIPDLQRSALQIAQRRATLTLIPSIEKKVAELRAELAADGPPPAGHQPAGS